jgi:hypothetical protein
MKNLFITISRSTADLLSGTGTRIEPIEQSAYDSSEPSQYSTEQGWV